jgi:hypothetical protein
MQCAYAILYYHLWPARLYNFFPILCYKMHDFGGEKKLSNIKSVFSFSLQILPETSVVVKRNQRDMIKNVYRPSCEVPVILVRF